MYDSHAETEFAVPIENCAEYMTKVFVLLVLSPLLSPLLCFSLVSLSLWVHVSFFITFFWFFSRSVVSYCVFSFLQIYEWVSQNEPILHLIELRFTASDSFALSGSYGRTACYATGLQFHSRPTVLADFFGMLQETAIALGGRPHLGKMFDVRGARFRALYPKCKCRGRARVIEGVHVYDCVCVRMWVWLCVCAYYAFCVCVCGDVQLQLEFVFYSLKRLDWLPMYARAFSRHSYLTRLK